MLTEVTAVWETRQFVILWKIWKPSYSCQVIRQPLVEVKVVLVQFPKSAIGNCLLQVSWERSVLRGGQPVWASKPVQQPKSQPASEPPVQYGTQCLLRDVIPVTQQAWACKRLHTPQNFYWQWPVQCTEQNLSTQWSDVFDFFTCVLQPELNLWYSECLKTSNFC